MTLTKRTTLIGAVFAVVVAVLFALTTTQTATALTGSVAERDTSYTVELNQVAGGTIESDASTGTVERIAGADRYATASSINDAVADANIYAGVIVASGENDKFADALAASGLSGMLNFPVVLVNGNAGALDSVATNTIENLLGGATSVGDVYVLGGENTISDGVMNDLYAFDADNYIERISGADRYETARETYTYEYRTGVWDGAYITVVKGNDFPDALGVAPFCATYGVPVLLTNQYTDTLEGYISSAAKQSDNALIVGGIASVNTSKELTLTDYADVMRISGDNRYETSVNLANWECIHGMDATTLGVATGTSFPDALGSGGFLSLYNAPLLLVSADTASSLYNYVDTARATRAFIFGGDASVSTTIESTLTTHIKDAGYGKATTGQTVTIVATPDRGYKLSGINVKTPTTTLAANTTGNTSTFSMPEANVTVTPTWEALPAYTITCTSGAGGSVSTNYTSAYEGETITVTVNPQTGYQLEELTVKSGNTTLATTATGTNTYTFTMPAAAVTVNATFEEIPEPGDYVVTLEQTTGGTIYADGCIVTEDGTLTANEGDVITIVPVADDGWTFQVTRYQYYIYQQWAGKEITTREAIEPSNGVYAIEMPAADVSFSAAWLLGDGDDDGNHTFEWVDDATRTNLSVCRGCGQAFLTGTEETEHTKPFMLDPNNTHDVSTYTQAINGGYWRCSTCGIIYINLPD